MAAETFGFPRCARDRWSVSRRCIELLSLLRIYLPAKRLDFREKVVIGRVIREDSNDLLPRVLLLRCRLPWLIDLHRHDLALSQARADLALRLLQRLVARYAYRYAVRKCQGSRLVGVLANSFQINIVPHMVPPRSNDVEHPHDTDRCVISPVPPRAPKYQRSAPHTRVTHR